MRRVFFLLFFALASSLFSQKLVPLGYSASFIRNADNSKTYEFHVGHINFLGSDGEFRKINTDLKWRPLLKVWEQDSASYACRIPQYADGLFTFSSAYKGSDYVLRASPMCAHVEGIVLNDDGSGQSVLYSDAFGSGIDLRVWATRNGLLKVIIIRKKPYNIAYDMNFDFQLSFPTAERLSNIRGDDGILWDKGSALSFKDRSLRLGEAGKEVFFNPALVWDAAGKVEPVDISIYGSDRKYYLRKTVSAKFLESATYPVYTDHPTSFYPGAGDGFCGRSDNYSS